MREVPPRRPPWPVVLCALLVAIGILLVLSALARLAGDDTTVVRTGGTLRTTQSLAGW